MNVYLKRYLYIYKRNQIRIQHMEKESIDNSTWEGDECGIQQTMIKRERERGKLYACFSWIGVVSRIS